LFCSKVYFSNGPGPFTEERASQKSLAHFEKSRDEKKLEWIKRGAFFSTNRDFDDRTLKESIKKTDAKWKRKADMNRRLFN